MSDVDSYIQRFSPEIRQRLTVIRQTALHVFGDADETLCHGLPALTENGMGILFYGAYKDHIAIRVGNDWVDVLKARYPQFRYTQYTITFAHNDPFPADVVRVICEWLRHGRSHAAGQDTDKERR